MSLFINIKLNKSLFFFQQYYFAIQIEIHLYYTYFCATINLTSYAFSAYTTIITTETIINMPSIGALQKITKSKKL